MMNSSALKLASGACMMNSSAPKLAKHTEPLMTEKPTTRLGSSESEARVSSYLDALEIQSQGKLDPDAARKFGEVLLQAADVVEASQGVRVDRAEVLNDAFAASSSTLVLHGTHRASEADDWWRRYGGTQV